MFLMHIIYSSTHIIYNSRIKISNNEHIYPTDKQFYLFGSDFIYSWKRSTRNLGKKS